MIFQRHFGSLTAEKRHFRPLTSAKHGRSIIPSQI